MKGPVAVLTNYRFFIQAYHSTLLDHNAVVGNMALLPIKTQHRGPAPAFSGAATDMDIVDEALYFFKANVFFRTYEIKALNQRMSMCN